MTETSKTILEKFQVRKSKKQKAAFRQWLCLELERAGCSPTVEKSALAHNVVAGDPETARVLFTAHYDTCAVMPFPNFITPRNLGWYLLFQLLLAGIMCLISWLAEIGAMLLFRRLSVPTEAAFPVFGAVLLFFCWWMLAGPVSNKHTANDNTSGVLTLVETALALPPEDRERVCFVFFDNEEKGMLGSSSFAKAHRQVKKNTPVVNFDCVSDGDSIQFFPTKALKRDADALARLERAFLPQNGKAVEIVRGFGFYPSDNASFRRSAGVCALRRSPVFGWYMGRIHTGRDTVMQEENIELLRDGCLRLVKEAGGDQ